MTSHIMPHANNNRMLNPLQPGFRIGLSCETQLRESVDDVSCNIDTEKQTEYLVMDFSETFD